MNTPTIMPQNENDLPGIGMSYYAKKGLGFDYQNTIHYRSGRPSSGKKPRFVVPKGGHVKITKVQYEDWAGEECVYIKFKTIDGPGEENVFTSHDPMSVSQFLIGFYKEKRTGKKMSPDRALKIIDPQTVAKVRLDEDINDIRTMALKVFSEGK